MTKSIGIVKIQWVDMLTMLLVIKDSFGIRKTFGMVKIFPISIIIIQIVVRKTKIESFKDNNLNDFFFGGNVSTPPKL